MNPTTFQKLRIFQKIASGILFLFLGILFAATALAYLRPSGFTGLDMSQIQKIRLEVKQQALAERAPSE